MILMIYKFVNMDAANSYKYEVSLIPLDTSGFFSNDGSWIVRNSPLLIFRAILVKTLDIQSHLLRRYLGCWTKNRGAKTPKMDGENNVSKPNEQMDDLGGVPHYFWFNTHLEISKST